MITQEKLKFFFDWNGKNFYWKVNRGGMKAGSIAGVLSHRGYRKISIDGKRYYEHRLVWLWHYGSMPKSIIDHIDGNTENNAIENLQDVKQSINTQKQRIRSTNKSGYKGVCWDKSRKKWIASITINLKQIMLGRYEKIEDAISARQKAAEMYHCTATEAAK